MATSMFHHPCVRIFASFTRPEAARRERHSLDFVDAVCRAIGTLALDDL